MNFVCPYCNHELSAHDADITLRGRCPHCGGAVSAPPIFASAHTAGGVAGSRSDATVPYEPNLEGKAETRAQVLRDLGVENPLENLVGTHFVYQDLIGGYAEQDTTRRSALLLLIEACEQHIAMAPAVARALRTQRLDGNLGPHAGYEQLCGVRERQGQYETVVLLAEAARDAGWSGPWDRLITRCKKTTIQRKGGG
jgi:hypothetical protein